jgi:hypothetical protein
VFYIIGLHLCGGVRWFGTAAKTIKQRSGFRAVLFVFACGVGYLI